MTSAFQLYRVDDVTEGMVSNAAGAGQEAPILVKLTDALSLLFYPLFSAGQEAGHVRCVNISGTTVTLGPSAIFSPVDGGGQGTVYYGHAIRLNDSQAVVCWYARTPNGLDLNFHWWAALITVTSPTSAPTCSTPVQINEPYGSAGYDCRLGRHSDSTGVIFFKQASTSNDTSYYFVFFSVTGTSMTVDAFASTVTANIGRLQGFIPVGGWRFLSVAGFTDVSGVTTRIQDLDFSGGVLTISAETLHEVNSTSGNFTGKIRIPGWPVTVPGNTSPCALQTKASSGGWLLIQDNGLAAPTVLADFYPPYNPDIPTQTGYQPALLDDLKTLVLVGQIPGPPYGERVYSVLLAATYASATSFGPPLEYTDVAGAYYVETVGLNNMALFCAPVNVGTSSYVRGPDSLVLVQPITTTTTTTTPTVRGTVIEGSVAGRITRAERGHVRNRTL